jgi:Zn-dependent oligopeptidase
MSGSHADVAYHSSQIFSIDIFGSAITSEDDIVLQGRLKKFRYEILQIGATVDERTVIEDFLGRKCSMDAFCRRFNVVGGADIGLLGTA